MPANETNTPKCLALNGRDLCKPSFTGRGCFWTLIYCQTFTPQNNHPTLSNPHTYICYNEV